MSDLTDGVQAGLIELSGSTLAPAAIDELRSFGTVRSVAAGEVLYAAGQENPPFVVVLDGETEILRRGVDGDVVVARHGAGRFLGELNLVTGQRAWLTARAATPTQVLVIEPPEFRRLMTALPSTGDAIFRTLAARRELLRTGEGAAAIRLIGSRYSPESMALRAYANHAHLAHQWIDLEDADDAAVLLASFGLRPVDVPVVTPRPRCSGARRPASSPTSSG